MTHMVSATHCSAGVLNSHISIKKTSFPYIQNFVKKLFLFLVGRIYYKMNVTTTTTDNSPDHHHATTTLISILAQNVVSKLASGGIKTISSRVNDDNDDLGYSPVTLSSDWPRVARLLLLASLAVIGSVGNVFMISAIMVEDHLKKRGKKINY